MSTVSLHNRNRGQRLRGERPDMPPSPGSRGCAPGELCHLLPPCCSNSRRDWLCQTVRLCECTPWVVSAMKSGGVSNHSEIPAKIPALSRKALSRIQYIFHTTACWLEARTGTSPPFYSQPP